MAWRSPRGEVINISHSNILVSEFELQSSRYVHLRTNTLGKYRNTLNLKAMDWIEQLISFYKDEFGIR